MEPLQPQPGDLRPELAGALGDTRRVLHAVTTGAVK